MVDRRTDPVGAAEAWQFRYQTACNAFRNGEFPYTEVVFRATLYGLGFRGQAIDAEVNLLKEPQR